MVEVRRVFDAAADRVAFGLQLAEIEFLMKIKLQDLQCYFFKNVKKIIFLTQILLQSRAADFWVPRQKN